MAKARRLMKLRIKENSGVDHPAHLHEGWLVMKAADTNDEVQLPAELAELMEKATDVAGLLDTLKGFDASGLDDDGTKMLAALISELEEEITDENEPPTPPPPANKNKGDQVKTAEELQKELDSKDEALTKALADIEELKKNAKPPEPDSEEEAMRKALDSMSEPLRKRFLQNEEDAQEARKVAKAERDLRESGEFIAKAREQYPNLSLKPEDFGPVLKALHEATPEAAKEIERVLASANAAVEHNVLLKEFGSGAEGGTGDSPYEQLQALSRSLMEKSDGTLDMAMAMDKAVQTPEGAALYEKYQAKKMGRG